MTFHAGIFHLLALLCTLLVEGAGMWLWARFAHASVWRALGCALSVNLFVHTLFWLSQSSFPGGWPARLYAAEAVVILVEGALYARLLPLSGITPWLLSALLNTASLLAGLWLWQQML